MKILIIDYRPTKETADIATAAAEEHHKIHIAAAEESTDPRIKRTYKIGNSIDRAMHRMLGYISDSYHLHSTRPTSALLNHIVEINPDIIHIHDIEEHYLNLPLLAYVLSHYKIPTLLTIANPDNIYKNNKALIKRKKYNSSLFTGTLASWDLLYLAFTDKETASHELATDHPGYIIDKNAITETYLQIYETIG